MNSFLNINVRVLAAQAQRELAALSKQIAMVSFSGPTGGVNKFGQVWSGLRWDRMGSQMQWLGRQIEFNFTLPLVAAATAATVMALENEKAMTRLTKVYGDGARNAEFYHEEINALERSFVALSNAFGVAQKDVINIAADWAAAGASGVALAKSVKLTMETMILGELNAAEATQSLIAIQAQYGQSISELTDTISILNMVENQTGVSMAGLVQGFARAAGVARTSGVTVRELAADLAALTPATGSAANAGNALKTIFSRLLSPTQDAAEVMDLMGLNIKSMAWQSASAQEKLIVMSKRFEELSDAQKGLVSSIIASRYQINRFEVLMRELNSTNGFYARAMASTADATLVYAQAQNELNRVLESSPQRLKILWTMIQNAAADIIQPLIPLILWLAEAIQRAMQAFSDLNPGLQKFILFGLAILALVGPIVRYFGAIQVLLFELFRGLGFIVPVFGFFVKLAASFVRLPLAAALFAASAGVTVLSASFKVLSFMAVLTIGLIQSNWKMLFGGLAVVAAGGWTAVKVIFQQSLVQLQRFVIGFALLAGALWRTMMTGIVAGGPIFVRAWQVMYMAIQALTINFAAFMGNIWRMITLIPILFSRAMAAGVMLQFSKLLPFLAAFGAAAMRALTGPWGIAVLLVLAIISAFKDKIVAAWNAIVSWFQGNNQALADTFRPIGEMAVAVKNLVIKAFNALPEGIRNALMAVINIIAAAARQIYEWFSYINPWAKHSPSLVENVTSGVAAIQNQFAKLTSVGSVFEKAGRDLEAFERAIAKVGKSAKANEFAEIRIELGKYARDALGPFDRLVKALSVLESQLKTIKKAMDAQESVVDALRDRLDAANDALETQKDLLQKMKDEADGYQERVNQLNGALEILTGTREALRSAGAGSDILSVYDDQIALVQESKSEIDQQMQAAMTAYAAQKKAVEELTAARDKLQDSYEAERKKLEQIRDSYDDINGRIQDINSSIRDFSQAIAELTKGSDLADLFAAGAGADFPDVSGSGMLGREGGVEDQSALIDEFTKEMAQKTKDMFGMFDFLSPIKNAWNTAVGWLKQNIGKPLGEFVGMVIDWFSKIPNPFESIDLSGVGETLGDIFGTIFDVISSIIELIGPPLLEIGKIIWDSLGEAFREIMPEVLKFFDLLSPLGELLGMIWDLLKPIVAIVGGVFLLALKTAAHVVAGVLGPALSGIIGVIKGVIQIFRGFIEFVIGVFTGNWKLAWKGILSFFKGIWDAIWGVLSGFFGIIVGAIKGFVEGIVGFFTWLWDKLVGHSIVPDIVYGIIALFRILFDVVSAIWNALWTVIKFVWDTIVVPVFTAIGKAFKTISDAAGTAFDWIKTKWEAIGSFFKGIWDTVGGFVQKIKDGWNGLVDFVSKLPGRFTQAAKDIFKGVVNAVIGGINKIIGAWNWLDTSFDVPVPDWLTDMMSGVTGQSLPKGLSYHFPDIFPNIPLIPMMARGGMVTNQATAIVGEGRKSFPEYVIPTDPMFRGNSMRLLGSLMSDLGLPGMNSGVLGAIVSNMARGTNEKVHMFASGGILGSGTIRTKGGGGAVIIAPQSKHTEYHFHGNLEFPNVRDGRDVEEFLRNLEALMDEE